MRSPTYSTMRVPLGMRRVANTPRPAMGDLPTRYALDPLLVMRLLRLQRLLHARVVARHQRLADLRVRRRPLGVRERARAHALAVAREEGLHLREEEEPLAVVALDEELRVHDAVAHEVVDHLPVRVDLAERRVERRAGLGELQQLLEGLRLERAEDRRARLAQHGLLSQLVAAQHEIRVLVVGIVLRET